MAYELSDAMGDVVDMQSAVETIENESYNWGAPNVEMASAEVKRALSKLAVAIQHWGETVPRAESGIPNYSNPFRWLECIIMPDGTQVVQIANTAIEITQDLFKAHRLYQGGDTLKALDQVEKLYAQWGKATVNALVGAMNAQLLSLPPGEQGGEVVGSPSTAPVQQG